MLCMPKLRLPGENGDQSQYAELSNHGVRLHFRLRDRGGDCRHDAEESLEVSCQGSGQKITLNGGDVGNGVEWELPCKSRVLFKKLHSAYYWGTRGCVRYVDDPRFWRVTTRDKSCR